MEAVRSAPRPTTKTQVRAFLGLAGYYRCFIPDFSSLAAPPDRSDQEGAAGKGTVVISVRGGLPEDQGGSHLRAHPPSPRF